MNADPITLFNDNVEIVPIKLINSTINIMYFDNDYDNDDGIVYDENGNNYYTPQKNRYDTMLEEYKKKFAEWEKIYIEESAC